MNSPTAEPTIRRARPSDLPEVLSILREATAWLESRGISWWANEFPAAKVEDSVRRGEVYVAFMDDDPAATITVDFRPDPELWGHIPDGAGYARRMAVSRKWAGHGLGAILLDWAGHLAASAGCSRLRLDANKGNLGLHVYYRRHGFEYLGEVDLPHRNSGALFQRPARILPRASWSEVSAS